MLPCHRGYNPILNQEEVLGWQEWREHDILGIKRGFIRPNFIWKCIIGDKKTYLNP